MAPDPDPTPHAVPYGHALRWYPERADLDAPDRHTAPHSGPLPAEGASPALGDAVYEEDGAESWVAAAESAVAEHATSGGASSAHDPPCSPEAVFVPDPAAPPWDLRRRVRSRDFGEAEFVTIRELRGGLADVLNRVAYGGTQIVVTRHGALVAAIVPTHDLQACQALQEHLRPRAEAYARLEEGDEDVGFECGMVWDDLTDRFGPC